MTKRVIHVTEYLIIFNYILWVIYIIIRYDSINTINQNIAVMQYVPLYNPRGWLAQKRFYDCCIEL